MVALLKGAKGAMGVVAYGNQGKGGIGFTFRYAACSILPRRTVFVFLVHFRVYGWGCAMAYYKVRIEVWCDWNPAESDLDDIAQSMGVGEAICTLREVVAVVNRPQDIEDEEAMSFFGGSEGDADESQG
jgi:hypothetical protein